MKYGSVAQVVCRLAKVCSTLFHTTKFQHHYSIKGGASAIGLGTDNCVQVACDER